MIHFDCDNIFSFKLPENLLKEINNLEVAINNNESYIDCIQDEIRSWAHGYSYDTKEDALTYGGITEDEAEEVITYFCRRRFRPEIESNEKSDNDYDVDEDFDDDGFDPGDED